MLFCYVKSGGECEKKEAVRPLRARFLLFTLPAIKGNNELTKHVMVYAAPKIYCYWRQVVCSAAAVRAHTHSAHDSTARGKFKYRNALFWRFSTHGKEKKKDINLHIGKRRRKENNNKKKYIWERERDLVSVEMMCYLSWLVPVYNWPSTAPVFCFPSLARLPFFFLLSSMCIRTSRHAHTQREIDIYHHQISTKRAE